MAGYGLPENVAAGSTGHVTHTNSVHDIVNKFDKDASPSDDQVLVWDSGTSLYVPETRALADQFTINAQTGTTYTLVLTDKGKLVTLSNAAAITCTVPPNSSVAFPVGTVVTLAQVGVGQVTVAAGAGVTVNGVPGLKLTDQWSSATLIKRATDTWLLVGRLSA